MISFFGMFGAIVLIALIMGGFTTAVLITEYKLAVKENGEPYTVTEETVEDDLPLLYRHALFASNQRETQELEG